MCRGVPTINAEITMKKQLAILFYKSKKGKIKVAVVANAKEARGLNCNIVIWLRIPNAEEFYVIHETMALIPEREQQMFLAQEDGLTTVNRFSLIADN